DFLFLPVQLFLVLLGTLLRWLLLAFGGASIRILRPVRILPLLVAKVLILFLFVFLLFLARFLTLLFLSLLLGIGRLNGDFEVLPPTDIWTWIVAIISRLQPVFEDGARRQRSQRLAIFPLKFIHFQEVPVRKHLRIAAVAAAQGFSFAIRLRLQGGTVLDFHT